ncbi:hypothetical protein ANCDUO_16849 [Ancylostoma duodenale]|uniref:Uncharacterized protein n=1 Tax=Ancylostoma duodenale TaxID=51022 RepID=A0A0C2C9Q1_9BILA|nr:hypothetical protein ANCDUO_16849 [Ancylostoma duodenale]
MNANADIWWNGPSFLRDHPDNWPNGGMDFTIPPIITSDEDLEFKEPIPALRKLSPDDIIRI